jgi:plasmid stability protein
MATLSKRATVYFDPDIHRALRLKAADTTRSISDLVNDALRGSLAEDAEDLEAFESRAHESLVSYEEMIKRLKADGRI